MRAGSSARRRHTPRAARACGRRQTAPGLEVSRSASVRGRRAVSGWGVSSRISGCGAPRRGGFGDGATEAPLAATAATAHRITSGNRKTSQRESRPGDRRETEFIVSRPKRLSYSAMTLGRSQRPGRQRGFRFDSPSEAGRFLGAPLRERLLGRRGLRRRFGARRFLLRRVGFRCRRRLVRADRLLPRGRLFLGRAPICVLPSPPADCRAPPGLPSLAALPALRRRLASASAAWAAGSRSPG